MSVVSIPAFSDQLLLETALTHRSALNEHVSQASESYERLEFLGDAVLELATTKYLYDLFPQEPEGVLSAYRSSLVKTETLAEVAAELGLDQRVMMNKGGTINDSILADVFEAVVGGLYLDQGYAVVTTFLKIVLFPKFAAIKRNNLYQDPKSLLQEAVQANGYPTPSYQQIKAVGPDHDKVFTVAATVQGIEIGRGTGPSKQKAQRAAAAEALEHWQERLA